jgi:hypothetical protein
MSKMYSEAGFLTEYNIQPQVFINFVWKAHYYYTVGNNPFHNFFHGVTVAHAGYYFLKKSEHLAKMLSVHERFGFVTACFGHDLDHRGKNNNFEIHTLSKLAIRYHDKSPLEQHHAAILFKILGAEESNIMENLPSEHAKEIRATMIENILATDMKFHFTMLADFKKDLLENEQFCQEPCSIS